GVRDHLQLLPLPGDGGPHHPARPAAAGDAAGDREAAPRLRARQVPGRTVRRLRRRHGPARLRVSQRSRRTGWDEIKDALPWTLLLVGTGTLLATLVGAWLGVIASTRRGRKEDHGLLGFSLFTYAAPEYWIGIILILVFAVWLGVLPAGLQQTPGVEFSSWLDQAANVAEHLILPAIAIMLM